MYVYDIIKNQSTEAKSSDISYLYSIDYGYVYGLARAKRIVYPQLIVISKEPLTIHEKLEIHGKLKLENETWKIIEGSDGEFKISNYGRCKRIFKNHERFLINYMRNKCGNMHVKVKYKGVYKQYRIKTLVAAHFMEEKKPGEILAHKNGIKTDDFVGNLMWIDRKVLGRKTGASSKSKGILQLSLNGDIVEEFRSTRDAERKTPYSRQSISDYCNKVRKNQYGHCFIWESEYEKLRSHVEVLSYIESVCR